MFNPVICSNCGKRIQFESEQTNVIVCTCNSVYEKEIDSIKEAREYKRGNDIPSRIRLGDVCTIKDIRYSAIGKYSIWGKQSLCNVWTFISSGGAALLLTEGYGFYAFLEKSPHSIYTLKNKLNNDGTHTVIELEGAKYRFVQFQEVQRWRVEGECLANPFPTKAIHILQNTDTGNCIEVWENKDEIVIYDQKVIEWEDLQLSDRGLRPLAPERFNCRQCNELIEVKHFPFTQSTTCPKCESCYFFSDNTNWLCKDLSNLKMTSPSLIPVGSVLKIYGDTFEVIGVATKKDGAGGYWTEYSLHCKDDDGFAFLVVSEGNYILVQEIMDFPVVPERDWVKYDGRDYELFLQYQTQIECASGEFVGDIFSGKLNEVCYDYIHPPYLLSLDRVDSKNNYWYEGVHVSRSEMKKQLSPLGVSLTPHIAIGMIEPASKYTSKNVWLIGLMMVALLILVHIIEMTSMTSKVILHESYSFDENHASIEVVSAPFENKKWRTNLLTEISTPLQNGWVTVDYTLTNTKTGEEYTAATDIEHYQGYEDGESWSEGSASKSWYFTAVPKGIYRLSVDLARSDAVALANNEPIQVKVTSGVRVGYNFWIPLLLICIFPIYLLRRIYSRNYQRKNPG